MARIYSVIKDLINAMVFKRQRGFQVMNNAQDDCRSQVSTSNEHVINLSSMFSTL